MSNMRNLTNTSSSDLASDSAQDTDAYAKAGVSIEAGNALVERIKPHAKATTRTGVMGALGGFGAVFDIKALGLADPLLISTTDGVGTKLKLAQEMRQHNTIGMDLVAMCVNDLIVQGAEPLYFLDYFACGRLSVEVAAAVIEGIAAGCKASGCALVGGETAEMPGMYKEEEYDLAGFAVGAVERAQLLPRADIATGDVLLGLGSSGAHSNGFALIRKILADGEFSLAQPAPFATQQSLGEVLLTPTRLYVQPVLSVLAKGGVKALAHITGGGITENLPRVLPAQLAAHIDLNSWQMPPLFDWLKQRGRISPETMLRTFNCGIGMVLVVAPEQKDVIIAALRTFGQEVFTLGALQTRTSAAVIYQ